MREHRDGPERHDAKADPAWTGGAVLSVLFTFTGTFSGGSGTFPGGFWTGQKDVPNKQYVFTATRIGGAPLMADAGTALPEPSIAAAPSSLFQYNRDKKHVFPGTRPGSAPFMADASIASPDVSITAGSSWLPADIDLALALFALRLDNSDALDEAFAAGLV